VQRTTSGLVAADPFDRGMPYRTLEDRYVFNGSARPGIGYALASSTGLQVGVAPHSGWAGWFAVTIHAAGPAVVWHTVMSRPDKLVTGGTGEAVFAVQTATTQSSGAINYVVVASVSRNGLAQWLVGYAHGEIADADTQVLWQSPATRDAPATESVTVTTDGSRSIAVWLGNRVVFQSDHLQLDIPPPFQAYLEVQGQDVSYVSRFQDLWVARLEPLEIRHVRPGAQVTLVQGGREVARGVADQTGNARLDLPPPESVGLADLVVDTPKGPRVYKGVSYAGGDVLALR
jgi:hypothetical protein